MRLALLLIPIVIIAAAVVVALLDPHLVRPAGAQVSDPEVAASEPIAPLLIPREAARQVRDMLDQLLATEPVAVVLADDPDEAARQAKAAKARASAVYKAAVIACVDHHGGNKTAAAKAIGISAEYVRKIVLARPADGEL